MTGMPEGGPLLPDWDDRFPWKQTSGSITSTETLHQAEGTGLLVVDATAPAEPTKTDLVGVWKKRSGGGVAPVLVVVRHPADGKPAATLLGLSEDAVPVGPLPLDIGTRIVADALNESSPTRLDSEFRRRTESAVGSVATGLRNEGLFATHVLDQVPTGAEWSALNDAGQQLLGKRGRGLLEGMGYTVEVVPDGTVLREKSGGQRRAAAVLLNDGENFENPLVRLAGTNAVTHGLALARREKLDWLVVVGGSVARLYPVSPDVGVGRKGQTQTFVEIDLALLPDDLAGYLRLLFAPEALAEGGYVDTLLEESARFATGLAERLRDRIYEDVIPGLAVSVASRFGLAGKTREEQRTLLDEAYHQAMIILFRLLFVAYAEDRGLLPYGKSERYTRNALKTLAKDMVESPGEPFSADSTTLWDDLTQVWKVIDTGDLEGWGVPPYNGGLFTRDANKNASGAATYKLDLTNAEIGPVLRGLLLDVTEDDVLGPVDFRSLSVREFGTIYEGLLESNLGVAEVDLTIDGDDFLPAKKKDTVAVSAGTAYFHSKSGSRKATGSYFTKPFAVEHLLDSALEPALDTHLGKVKALLGAGKHRDAAALLFDFRATDLSMGSAHFLVSAVDRIEARFSAFLTENPLPEVLAELDGLRTAAAGRLGSDPAEAGIDDSTLLRRQIARRCIYGVDINELAVELARLAIWIHTFVPGLPLSFLNHSLVHGNSLTGVGTLDEITAALQEAEERETRASGAGNSMLLGLALDEFMIRAGAQLDRMVALADASVADVAAAAEIQAEIDAALEPLACLCDLITAERATRHLGFITVEEKRYDAKTRKSVLVKKRVPHEERVLLSAKSDIFTAADADSLRDAVLAHPHLARARAVSARVQARHLPVSFPEVFRRSPAGFDAVVGNPPWEKLKVETSRWWALRFPGLRSMPQGEQDDYIAKMRHQRPDLAREIDDEIASTEAARQTVIAGPYPGIGRGDLDLYKAFAWRFLQVLRISGRLGVVVPRSLLSEKGTAPWRAFAFDNVEWTDVTLLVNSGRWAFEQIHPQYTIALMTVEMTGQPSMTVVLRGPAHNMETLAHCVATPGIAFPAQDFRQWGEGDAFRIIESAESAAVYQQMMTHPSLGSTGRPWRARPFAEVHSTADKPLMDLTQTGAGTGIPVYKGESFNIWEPDTGIYYARAVEKKVIAELLDRRKRGQRNSRSPFSEFTEAQIAKPDSLPALNARIAFRKIARATDSRTIIPALVPPHTLLSDGAPYLLWPNGNEKDQAFVLGLLCSIPLDWAARNVVEVNVNYPQINSLPIPDPGPGHPLRDRLVEVAGRLAATDARFTDWAKAVGVPVGSVDARDKVDLVAEVDALASLLYGLSRDQVVQVFSSFHRGWKYETRLAAVLAHFDAWAAKAGGGPA